MDVRIRQALSDFVEALREKHRDNVLDVKLYGSYARGDEQACSDIDVLVVVRDETIDKQLEIGAISAEISLRYDVVLASFVVSQDHLHEITRLNTLFSQNIRKDGIPLWTMSL